MGFLQEEKKQIAWERADAPRLSDPAQGDFEDMRIRYFVNSASDLLKYVYFFAAVKNYIAYMSSSEYRSDLYYAICYRKIDKSLLQIYPDIMKSERVMEFEYCDP